MAPITYFAVPYSDPDPTVRRERFHIANLAAAALIRRGIFVYSPISHTHPIAVDGALDIGWTCWRNLDLEMLRRCSRLLVLELPGWDTSVGVQAEIAEAQRLELTIHYCEPYLPCNDNEGMKFTADWCDKCSRRSLNPERKKQCSHEARACLGERNERWFWIGYPTCLSFRDRSVRQPRKQATNKDQLDLALPSPNEED